METLARRENARPAMRCSSRRRRRPLGADGCQRSRQPGPGGRRAEVEIDLDHPDLAGVAERDLPLALATCASAAVVAPAWAFVTMTVTLARRADIDLDAFQPCGLGGRGGRRSTTLHSTRWPGGASSFWPSSRPIPTRKLYGVNVHAGDGADRRLASASDQRYYARGLHSRHLVRRAAAAAGRRGVVLSRLANFIEGHAGVSAELVGSWRARLDGRRLPPVPRYGNGGAGEIQALGWLFEDVRERSGARHQGAMALINGSPCAPALLADAVLAAAQLVTAEPLCSGLCLRGRRAWGGRRPPMTAAGRAVGRPVAGSRAGGAPRRLNGADTPEAARARATAGRLPDPPARVRQRAPGAGGGPRGGRGRAAAVSDNPVFLFA